MDLNTTGLVAALATFLGIWLGHVAVRKIEYLSPTVWVPALVALCLGLVFEASALLSEDLNLSAALGIFGFTLLWDALEFWRQERRVIKGHAPANPDNPRHARLLATGAPVTAIDWLKRDPQGRPLTSKELQAMQEGTG
jgi:hypothetical protein